MDEKTLTDLIISNKAFCGAILSNDVVNLKFSSGNGCKGRNIKYLNSNMFGFFFICEDCGQKTYVNRP